MKYAEAVRHALKRKRQVMRVALTPAQIAQAQKANSEYIGNNYLTIIIIVLIYIKKFKTLNYYCCVCFVEQPEYLGCFADQKDAPDFPFAYNFTFDADVQPLVCAEVCRNQSKFSIDICMI